MRPNVKIGKLHRRVFSWNIRFRSSYNFHAAVVRLDVTDDEFSLWMLLRACCRHSLFLSGNIVADSFIRRKLPFRAIQRRLGLLSIFSHPISLLISESGTTWHFSHPLPVPRPTAYPRAVREKYWIIFRLGKSAVADLIVSSRTPWVWQDVA
jgi:hypothetical protein